MNLKKRCKYENDTRGVGDKVLEDLHRDLFDHPESEKSNTARWLAQPSFLKQVDSRASGHSQPANPQPETCEKEFFNPDEPRIEDVIRGIAREVPDEEWEKLLHDLTDRLDYYLYGAEDP